MKKYFVFFILVAAFSLSAHGEEVPGDVRINLANLEEQAKSATTGTERAILHKKIASSKDVDLILASLSTQLSGGVLEECFKSRDDDFKSELAILILKSDLKAWEWANPSKAQVLSGGMAVAYMGYASPCIKVLQKYFPDEEFLIGDFRFKDRRIKFADRLEIALGKKPRDDSGKSSRVRAPRKQDITDVESQIRSNRTKTNSLQDSASSTKASDWQNKWLIILTVVLILGGVFIWLKTKSRV